MSKRGDIERLKKKAEEIDAAIETMLTALVQAELDSRQHPDGPFLGPDFYSLLREAGVEGDVAVRVRQAEGR